MKRTAVCPDCGGARQPVSRRCFACHLAAKRKPTPACIDCGVTVTRAGARCSPGAGTARRAKYRPTRYVGKHEETNGGGQRYLDVVTVDWRASCSCDADVAPCVVLDPFMGSGTVALTVRELGRRAVGIELSEEYAALCAQRLQQQSLFAGDAA